MLETEERLFEEYKIVDNICRDIFSSQSGVSQYITEMERYYSYGHSLISSWDNDYRMLKHIRWLRNKIVHESYATDCNDNDVLWLKEFHHRLLERRDPLALLRTANRERLNCPPRREHTKKTAPPHRMSGNAYLQRKKRYFLNRVVAVFIGVCTALVVFIIVLILIKIAKIAMVV